MSELTDDQLDGLFRKSAEEFEPPFDPAAWQDMKARLDATDHTRPGGAIWKNLLRWGLPLLLLLLLTGGGWYAYRKASPSRQPVAVSPTNKASTSRNTTTDEETNQSETSRLAGADLQRTQPIRSPETAGNDEMPLADRTELASRRSDSKTRSEVSRNPIERLSTTGNLRTERATKSASPSYKSVTGRNRGSRSQRVIAVGEIVGSETEGEKNPTRKPVAFAENRAVRQRRGTRRNGTIFSATGYALTTAPSFTKRRQTGERKGTIPGNESFTAETVRSEPVQNDVNNDLSTSSINVVELAGRPAKWPQLSFTDRPVQFQSDKTEQSVPTRPPVQLGLSVRLAIAPDLSTVGLKDFSRPGTNVGAFLEYRFASRWSVQAGVIRSTKVYRALPDEYTAAYGEWGGHITPLSIDGRCTMLDIPINLRYDIAIRPRANGLFSSRWFVSSGVTSYIIKQENYVYNYPMLQYPQNMGKDVSTGTGGYGFSNLNLSVGYERAISRRLSWQVEPFMKVPLKGVGYFKVDLLSTGAFFSIRFKL